MSVPSPTLTKTGSIINIAFAVVVLASYFSFFSVLPQSSTLQIILIIILGIAYISIGTYGYSFVVTSVQTSLRVLYFAVQIPLGAGMVYLGGGSGFNAMVLLPLVGHSVLLLPQTVMIITNIAIAAAYMVALSLTSGDWAASFSGLAIFVAGQVFIIAFTQMALNEEKARNQVERLLAELEAANQRLRLYASQVEELAIAKERNRLAREIHDGLGHYLTTIHMQIQAARAIVSTNPQRAGEELTRAQYLTQDALVDVRRSVAALRLVPGENLPLPERIGGMLKDSEKDGILTQLIVTGKVCSLPPELQLALYRAVQECINNTSKHAHAANLWVTLDYTVPHQVSLYVKDDGQGADHLDGGFGLLGIRERVHLLEGEVHINTAPGMGFEVEIVIPYEPTD